MRWRVRVGAAAGVAVLLMSGGLNSRWVAGAAAGQAVAVRGVRSAEGELEVDERVGGAVKKRYVSREELLRMPQMSAVVSDDPDIPVTMRVSGVRLGELEKALGIDPALDLVDALCTDGYRAYYTKEMIAAHRQLLVLTIDGMEPKAWAAKAKQEDPGPYLVLYDGFKPAWRVLAHVDRPQLPTNVVTLIFERQAEAFGRIVPGGASVKERQGYEIARQNCIRCHAAGSTGGTKSGVSWAELGRDARERPEWFARMVKDPNAVSATATMPGNPEYDGATLGALTAYFRTQSIEGER